MSETAVPSIAPDCPAEPAWRGEVRALYEELDRDVAALGPVCLLSGRCCRFEQYGHTLFVSSPEVQFLLDAGRPIERPLDQGATCPWQNAAGHCTARGARPLGCRVFYCDSSYEPAASELSEKFIRRLKNLANRHRLPWNYAPLWRHLQGHAGTTGIAIRPALHDPQEFAQ